MHSGRADLRGMDFESKSIALNGEWEFYHFDFIKPGDTSQTGMRYLQVPKLWSKDSFPSKGFGSYRMTLTVDARKDVYALHVPDIFSSYTMFVNSFEVTKKGEPGKTMLTTRPFRSVKVVALPHSQDGTYEIVFHVANYRHKKGGIEKPVLFGRLSYLQTEKYRSDAFNLFFAGCMLIASVFFFGLFIFSIKERVPLYLALFCVVYGYRNLGAGNYILHEFISFVPWELLLRTEFICLYLAGLFFASYVLELFPKESPRLWLNLFRIVSGLWVIMSVFLPTDVITGINIPYIYLALVYVVIFVIVFIKAAFNNRSKKWLLFLNVSTILLVFSLKILDFLEYVELPFSFFFILEVVFFTSQSLLLAEYFTSKWKKSSAEALEATKVKSNFLSVISHEIRTPLNIIIGTIYHLNENAHEDQIEDLNNLKISSDNLLSLVNDVLDYNKIEAGKVEFYFEQTEIREFIKDIIDSLSHKAGDKKIRLMHEIGDAVPQYILSDKVRLRQILNNLLGNAIKFTDLGHIKIQVKYLEGNESEARLRFIVSDTGIGISRDNISQIFDSFSQADSTISQQFGGTGLGLAITKQLVDLLDSKLEVDSEEGMGTTFQFELKVDIPDTVAVTEIIKPKERNLKGLRILLVEDNPMNEVVAKRLLLKWNAKVDVARNGKIAVDKAAISVYDTILMDLQMPEMNGYEASAVIREQGFRGAIIALTASAMIGSRNKIYKAGMNDKVSKPFDPEDLFMTISNNLKI